MVQSLQLIHSRKTKESQPNRRIPDHLEKKNQIHDERRIHQFPERTALGFTQDGQQWPDGSGLFFNDLSMVARREFEWIAAHLQCPRAMVLIAEDQEPFNIFFLLEGQVDISMNSSDGKRFLLEVAGAGEIIGLTSAISGDRSGIRAETRYPCKIASMCRHDFLDFLLRYPVASQNVSRALSLHCTQACERLRIFGFASAIPERLACLLLEWCRNGKKTESGIEVRLTLTHEEIGECIGSSRESVSRALSELKSQALVTQRGSILIVPSRKALAIYAGVDTASDSDGSAA